MWFQTSTGLSPRHWLLTWLCRSFSALCDPFVYFCFGFLWFGVVCNKSLHSPTTLSNSPLFSSNISRLCILLLLSWILEQGERHSLVLFFCMWIPNFLQKHLLRSQPFPQCMLLAHQVNIGIDSFWKLLWWFLPTAWAEGRWVMLTCVSERLHKNKRKLGIS